MNQKVRLTKVDSISSLELNFVVISSDSFYVEGYLKQGPIIGQPVVLFRTIKNGEKNLGSTKTSDVVEIYKRGFKTKNSIYRIDFLHEKNID
jgi:hypothetical protein